MKEHFNAQLLLGLSALNNLQDKNSLIKIFEQNSSTPDLAELILLGRTKDLIETSETFKKHPKKVILKNSNFRNLITKEIYALEPKALPSMMDAVNKFLLNLPLTKQSADYAEFYYLSVYLLEPMSMTQREIVLNSVKGYLENLDFTEQLKVFQNFTQENDRKVYTRRYLNELKRGTLSVKGVNKKGKNVSIFGDKRVEKIALRILGSYGIEGLTSFIHIFVDVYENFGFSNKTE
jgi:hypothetical protein